MPYASEKVAVNLVNLPYIGEIGRQGYGEAKIRE